MPHLFGGERDLLEDLTVRLDRAGGGSKCAIAGTRGGAWALARHGGGVIPEGGLAKRLGRLTAIGADAQASGAGSIAQTVLPVTSQFS